MRLQHLLITFLFLCFFLGGISPKANATHIVGGEFELLHLQDSTYQLRLILYTDGNSTVGGDGFITYHIYRIGAVKGDDPIASFTVTLDELADGEERNVSYGGSCDIKDDPIAKTYKTLKFTYTASSNGLTKKIILSPDIYNNEAGYYVVWERCCRNAAIKNITLPDEASQAFYMEFPPVTKDGSPFINSSPTLFPPITNYACVGQEFFFNTSGADSDGDSLTYSLVAPLNGNLSQTNWVYGDGINEPDTIPVAPYPTVNFADGYNIDNMILGTPPLHITTEGRLKMTPTEPGVYVFAILCEEWRDDVVIGKVTREFQLLVTEECPNIELPNVGVTDTTYNSPPNSGEVFISGEPGQCIEFFILDNDTEDQLSVQIIPPADAQNGDDIPVEIRTTNGEIPSFPIESIEGDTLSFMVCIKDECVNVYDVDYEFELLVSDGRCSAAVPVTTKIFVRIEAPRDIATQAQVSGIPSVTGEDYQYYAEVNLGASLSFDMLGVDIDPADSVRVRYAGVGFNLEEVGMDSLSFVVTGLTNSDGKLISTFDWTAIVNCNLFGNNGTDFFLDIIAEDLWECAVADADTTRVKVHVNIPDNDVPTVKIENAVTSTELDFNSVGNYYETKVQIGKTLKLNSFGLDLNLSDSISMSAAGIDFDINNTEGLSFTEPPKNIPILGGALEWTAPLCDYLYDELTDTYLDEKEYFIDFAISDYWECGILTSDTVRLKITLFKSLPSDAPEMELVNSQNAEITLIDAEKNIYGATLFVGQDWSANIKVTDRDGEYVRLKNTTDASILTDFDIITNLENDFTPNSLSTISWKPLCEMFTIDNIEDFESTVTLTFEAKDPVYCFAENMSTMTIQLTIKMPPNAIPTAAFEGIQIIPEDENTFNMDENIVSGDSIKFFILGKDEDTTLNADGDDLTIDIEGIDGDGNVFDLDSLGMSVTQDALDENKYLFEWTTTCSDLTDDFQPKTYQIKIDVEDTQLCGLKSKSTTFLNLTVKDRTVDYDIPLPNAFTPNGDGKNDTYSIPTLSESGEGAYFLPEDNCAQQFQSIRIFNRWGEQVYSNASRNFSWEAEGFSAGTYFYVISYTKKQYKGSITLLKGN